MQGAAILPADMGMKIVVIKENNCDDKRDITLCTHACAKGLPNPSDCLHQYCSAAEMTSLEDTRSVLCSIRRPLPYSEVIKCPTTGAASFGQSPYIARHPPVRGVVGHNIDRRISPHQR